MMAVIPGIPGPFELVIVVGIVLLLFGKRLPDVMRSLGRSVVEFKRGVNEIDGPEDGSTDGSNSTNDPNQRN